MTSFTMPETMLLSEILHFAETRNSTMLNTPQPSIPGLCPRCLHDYTPPHPRPPPSTLLVSLSAGPVPLTRPGEVKQSYGRKPSPYTGAGRRPAGTSLTAPNALTPGMAKTTILDYKQTLFWSTNKHCSGAQTNTVWEARPMGSGGQTDGFGRPD